MKIIDDKDLRQLRLKKEISQEDAAKLRGTKAKPVPEDKQSKALEKIAAVIALSLQARDKHAQIDTGGGGGAWTAEALEWERLQKKRLRILREDNELMIILGSLIGEGL